MTLSLFKTAWELYQHPDAPSWCPYSSGWVAVPESHPFPFVGQCTAPDAPGKFIVPVYVYEICMTNEGCPFKPEVEE